MQSTGKPILCTIMMTINDYTALSWGKNKSYTDRLIYLNLPTLKYRCLRGDVIEVFKITHNLYDRTVSPDLPFNERANTRGNHYKLQNHLCHYDLRMHFFSACIVNIWNSLPNSVVDTCTVNAFKARFDKFWRHQIVKFYFTAPSSILQLIWWVPQTDQKNS